MQNEIIFLRHDSSNQIVLALDWNSTYIKVELDGTEQWLHNTMFSLL